MQSTSFSRLTKLRSLMQTCNQGSPIDAYIITSNDCHMSEYTSESDQRRKFITGFGGSAGVAVVTRTEALLWTDARYFLEAEQCLDSNYWKLMKAGLPTTPTIIEWLKKLPASSVIGTDPRCMTFSGWKDYSKTFRYSQQSFIPIDTNLIDVIWNEEQKANEELSTPYIHDVSFAGSSWEIKVEQIRKVMAEKQCDLLVLSALDEIAWLLNLRGSDIHCCPVFKSFCFVSPTKIYLCIDKWRITPEVMAHLKISTDAPDCVSLHPYSATQDLLKSLIGCSNLIWINDRTPAFLGNIVPKTKMLLKENPVSQNKAVKNQIEIANLKLACIRDAACLCEFFGFLESKTSKSIDEVEAAEYLHSLRSKMKNFIMNSFDAISCVGSNAAIMHYHPKKETCRKLDRSLIYLCDSGGNYLDGTTDITRTLHFGTPTEKEKEAYTLVLKGHIALARTIFPKGCSGVRIDAFARQHLWNLGLDYLHGTGHGIGMFLNVHEGPQRISSYPCDVPLEVGHVLSNEPGYYEDGNFGIRIEGMMQVVPVSTKYNFQKTEFFGFENLAYIPMHQALINPSLLTLDEISWLNNYHQKCIDLVAPELEFYGFKNGHEYLNKNAKPISLQ